EITRTHKLRREFMEDKYSDIINAIYEGRDILGVETVVMYQSGKSGSVSMRIHINPVRDQL
ncbi:MAG: hypothetical protein SV375_16225, partial [Thermodesulfobacteriota bacterium]|nr:hypothetical protein [Thermodesulfobacteriota bacterium]